MYNYDLMAMIFHFIRHFPSPSLFHPLHVSQRRFSRRDSGECLHYCAVLENEAQAGGGAATIVEALSQRVGVEMCRDDLETWKRTRQFLVLDGWVGRVNWKARSVFKRWAFTFLKLKKEEQEQRPIKKQPELFSKSRFYGSSLALRKDLYSLTIIGPSRLAILRTLPLLYRFKPFWRVQVILPILGQPCEL